jgi:2,4-didehydro-3-deoxy-L-rhamnonate hydrolase
MKLFRFGELNKEKPGVILNNVMCDASAFGEDYNEHFFEHNGLQRLKEFIVKNDHQLPEISAGVRLGSAVARPSKLVCIGLNYAKHALETGAGIPPEPVIFFKSTTALAGPNDDLIIPKGSVKTDWEVELAIVISKKASYIKEENADEYIAGYVLHNDYSERAFQMERNGQWVKGKSCDSFAPLGPFLATKDEVIDPQNLNLWLKVNEEELQHSNTGDMIFKIPFLIHYLSQFMTLLPGDVISTGTPFGVGLGFKPPRYLKAGDIIELGIESLGTQRQMAISYEQALLNGFY